MRKWSSTAFVVVVIFLSLRAVETAQVTDLPVVKTKGECVARDKEGQYNSQPLTIGSDGQVHTLSLRAPNNYSTLLGAYIKTKRNKYDGGEFLWECPVNVPFPPTPANSEKRRCSGAAQDMSVEYCKSVGGQTSSLACAFVNAAAGNAGAENPKDIELFACWGK